MAYKVFLAPTGSGNTVFEGDVLNGYTTPDGKKVSLQFFSNDRGYTAAHYVANFEEARRMREELAALLERGAARSGVFAEHSAQGHFRLARELDGAPLVLFFQGTDPIRGRSFHRGDAETLRKVLAEFDQVLGTIGEVIAGKGPAS